MPKVIAPLNTFGTQSGQVPSSQLDANFVQLGAQITGPHVMGLTGANNAGTPNTKVDLAAAAVWCYDPVLGKTYLVQNPGTLTVDVSLAGPAANGRDQAAAFGASSWLHLFYIYNPTSDTLALIASLNVDTVGPASLPAGYTAWAYAVAIRYNATPLLLKTRFRGAWAHYDSDADSRILSNGQAAVETAITISGIVPPNALGMLVRVELAGAQSAAAATNDNARIRVVSGTDFDMTVNALASTGASAMVQDIVFLVPYTGNLYYLVTRNSSGGAPPAAYIGMHAYKMPNGGE
jgi:hypothetical protein